MKLTRLDIQQLPGLTPGFSVTDIAPGINLVTGPNAIGKSSLIRALRYLVAAPSSTDPLALFLRAEFSNGGDWTVSRIGAQQHWEQSGQRRDPPSLPDRDVLYCYWLTMEDLVTVGDDDRALVAQLRQTLTGGYDLRALREGEFELRPRVGLQQNSALQSARAELREIESTYSQLRKDEEALPQLRQQIAEARDAVLRAEQLGQALELLDILDQRAGLEAELARYPSAMERLRGNEPDRLDRLEAKRGERGRALESAAVSCREAQQRLERTGLRDQIPARHELDTVREALDECGRLREQIDSRRERLGQLQAEERFALEALGGTAGPPSLAAEQVSRAEQLAVRLKDVQLARADCAARIRDSEELPEEQLVQRHALAVEALMRWQSAGGRRTGSLAGALAGGLAGLLVMTLAALDRAWWVLAAGTVSTVGALWGAYGLRGDQAGAARREFERQGLEGPPDWLPEAVRQRQEALQQQLERLRDQRNRALAGREERQRLDRLDAELATLEQQKQALSAELGFDPSLTAVSVDHFVRHLDRYRQAVTARQAAESHITALEENIREAVQRAAGYLQGRGYAPDNDPSMLNTAFQELLERSRAAEEAGRDVDRFRDEQQRLARDIETTDEDIAALYREAGLEPGARRELEACIGQYDSWKSLRERVQESRIHETARRQRLQDVPQLIARAEAGDREWLTGEREEATTQAARLEEWRGQASDIAARLEHAGADRKMEAAVARLDESRAQLEDRLNEQLFAEAGRFLLDDVEREHHSEHQPEVLRDARERFARFTHHAWDLEIHEQGMLARDRRQNVLRELHELSSGTRMQLLLAVRLAWTRRLEQGRAALPLFLDEALTTSDEARFAAVVQSLAMLARDEGRQIFYLSARRHDLALWEQAAGERPHHIDLAQLRFGRSTLAAPDLVVPPETAVPAPRENQRPEEYAARLAVPAADPSQPAGSLHVFHLLRDDLDLLYRLMQHWRVTTLGQLEALLGSSSAAAAVPDAAFRGRLQGRCDVARNWMAVWWRGRNRAVDSVVLQQSEAVSDTFLDAVSHLADEVGGDPGRLIAGLEARAVPRFQTRNIVLLREYLEQEGYISPDEPLDQPSRERQVLMEAGRAAPPEDIRQVVGWLEAAVRDPAPVEPASV